MEDTEPRICVTCNQVKPLSEFGRGGMQRLADGTRKRYVMHECKACNMVKKTDANRRWREKNKQKRQLQKPENARKKSAAPKPHNVKGDTALGRWGKSNAMVNGMKRDVAQVVQQLHELDLDERQAGQVAYFVDMLKVDESVARGALKMLLNDLGVRKLRAR